MIEQLPIINLLLLLGTALIIPLFKKRPFQLSLTLCFLVLLTVLVSSVFLLIHVLEYGEFYYHFGNHENLIGIEFLIDAFSAFFTVFVAALVLVIYLYSWKDKTEGIENKEFGRYYILLFILLFSIFGILYSNDLFNTYVFIEILSITSCAIISIKRKKETYTAAFRYVMLNEIASMSYLLGVALIYMITGHLNLERVATSLQSIWPLYSTNIIIAIGFMTIGVGIKAAIFPFHIWLPDAHATAPSTSSAILSGIVVKIYILVLVKLLFRVFGMEIVEALHIKWIMLILGSAGMIMGSIFAIAQKDVKRMLGYSSVAQIGYIILGIGLFTEAGLQAAFFHIISHGIMKAALFLSVGVIIYYKHVQKLKDFEGIGYQMPISMTVFSFGALGMVGIPLTSGFISKFNLGIAVIDANLIFFLIIIILSGLLNVVYYFPIVISAFLKDNKEMQKIPHIEKVPNIMLIPILTLGVAIVVLGLFPNLIMDIIVSVVATLF